MKIVMLTLCLAGVIMAEEKYGTINEDTFDVSQLLQNDRLLTAYAKCLVNKGPCTKEVKQVKDKLPEALATRCAKCTDRQKEIAKKLAKGVKRTHPELWDELVAFYDPEGKYSEAFSDYLKP